MTGMGTHILLDLYGCNPDRLNDMEFLRRMSLEGVRRSGATIMGEHFKQFDPQGVSGVVIIAESHLSLHTWPEFSYIAMDYFTCGDRIDIDEAVEYFEEMLGSQKVVKSKHTRGKELHGDTWPFIQEAKTAADLPWQTEYHFEGEEVHRPLLGYQYAMDRELVRTRSDYQEIMVMENPVYGRMLFLDGYVMTTEKDEFVYHEMLAHVPLVIHDRPQRVLIIGGGDGGLLREVLRHTQVERIDMVEIDAKVVEVAERHLPAIGSAFGDRRAHLHFEDGAHFVRAAKELYDVILVDSTDPLGPGRVLFERPFYDHCRRALRTGGIFAAQALSPWVQEKEQAAMFANLWEVWNHIVPYVATVPTYPGGLWTFALAMDRLRDPLIFDREYAASIAASCRYYNPEVHWGAHCLPNFIKERLQRNGPLRH
jgi:spermidine synthase